MYRDSFFRGSFFIIPLNGKRASESSTTGIILRKNYVNQYRFWSFGVRAVWIDEPSTDTTSELCHTYKLNVDLKCLVFLWPTVFESLATEMWVERNVYVTYPNFWGRWAFYHKEKEELSLARRNRRTINGIARSMTQTYECTANVPIVEK